MSDVALATLIVRRLCHDFAGPTGAIGTAVEMLSEASDDELIALAADGVATLTAALELYRFLMAPAAGPVGGGRAAQLFGAWLAVRGGPALEWGGGDGDWPPGVAALTAGLGMVAVDAGARGLKVTRGLVRADGARLSAETQAALAGGAADTTAAALAAVLAGQAAALGRTLRIKPGEPLELAVG